MKLVTVVIKPFKLEDVREALSSVGIQGLTVTEVKGFGRQKGHAELYRGAEYSVNFLPKVKIDIAIADDQLDEVVDVISKAAFTGKIGDGKISLLNCSVSFVFAPAKPMKQHCNHRLNQIMGWDDNEKTYIHVGPEYVNPGSFFSSGHSGGRR